MPVREPEIINRAQSSKDAIEADLVCGCCMLLSRTVCQTVGLLDDSFFWGMEETDICIRARKQGFKVLLVPQSKIWHVAKTNAIGLPMKLTSAYHHYYLATKARFMFMERYSSKLQFASATLFFIRGLVGTWLGSSDREAVKLRFRGFLDYLKERRTLRRKRGDLHL